PVVAAFMQHEESRNFARDEVRETVIPTYMGLVSEIDDHVGRLMAFLGERGRLDDTLIVFTSDHGDFLGDHWLGEKEMFHEEAVRIPMIVVDPDGRSDATRGRKDSRLVEAIDLVPTFLDALGGEAAPHRQEGRSLLPLLAGEEPGDWRDAVFSEGDYAWRHARHTLGLAPDETRAIMVRTERWKYVAFAGFRPQLFDLEADPGELRDLGEDEDHAAIRRMLEDRIANWLKTRRLRTTMSNEAIAARTGTAKQRGYLFGVW
ncbi:MAG: sulfatase-like hydrolase/transferase, partial [Rhodospirillales bacterium]